MSFVNDKENFSPKYIFLVMAFPVWISWSGKVSFEQT